MTALCHHATPPSTAILWPALDLVYAWQLACGPGHGGSPAADLPNPLECLIELEVETQGELAAAGPTPP